MTDFSQILIVSDIDGTFLDSMSRMVERNVREVERFVSGGGLFTFSTGRFKDTLYEVVPEYERYMSVPGIFSNGACVYDPKTDSCIESRFMDGRASLPLLREIAERYPSLVIRCTRDDGLKYLRQCGDAEMTGLPWHKIVIEGEPATVDEARSFILKTSGDSYYYSKSCPQILELLRPDATKGTMLRALTGYLRGKGLDFCCYAIGDYENDIPMLLAADVGVCPENALDDVKAVCRLKVCRCDLGSVGELIKTLTNS